MPQLTFTEGLLCIGHFSKHAIWINLFNAIHPHKVGNDTDDLLTEEETEVYGSEETRPGHTLSQWLGWDVT